jgi:TolB-like protein
MKNLPKLIIIITLITASCATYVPIKSVRKPTIDTSGIDRIAIKDFDNKSGVRGPVMAQITRRLTEKATQTIQGAGKFTIVAVADPNADGIFTGEIRSFETKDTSDQVQRKDKDGKSYTVTVYNREVLLEFSYSVISSRTGMPIGTVVKKGTQTSYAENDASTLADTQTLAFQIVDNQMQNLRQDIVPYIVSSNRKLMNETSKDKIVKTKMKEALTLVKSGNYDLAMQRYNSIAMEHNSVAARTNADLLRQSVESDASARTELNRLYSERGGTVDRAINNAVNLINTNIPSGENITILKTSSAQRDLLDRFVEETVTSVVQSRKLRVIDRSNQDLIYEEQNFQLSGNVSDESAVSIGKQLGIHYIVLCWISGEMSGRRVNLRVLNVETTQIIIQDAFDI